MAAAFMRLTEAQTLLEEIDQQFSEEAAQLARSVMFLEEEIREKYLPNEVPF